MVDGMCEKRLGMRARCVPAANDDASLRRLQDNDDDDVDDDNELATLSRPRSDI